MGSGKSEAARRFRERGIPVIDADQLGHRALEPGASAEAAVREAFGPSILTDGIIDRRKLGRLVFSQPEARRRLNRLVHPRVHEAILAEAAALERDGQDIVLVEAALWGEDGALPAWMDALILVECAEALRAGRVMRGRGMPMDAVRRRMAAQRPPEEKRSLADYVIVNEDGIDAREARVDALTEGLYGRSKRT